MTWLTILEYSYRNKISLSTLRRKIKAQGIEHKMDSGRYLVKVENDFEEEHRDSVSSSHSSDVVMLVQELKKAYGMVLSEKEEMIMQLKEEIATQKKIIEFLEIEINKQNNHNPNHLNQPEDNQEETFLET